MEPRMRREKIHECPNHTHIPANSEENGSGIGKRDIQKQRDSMHVRLLINAIMTSSDRTSGGIRCTRFASGESSSFMANAKPPYRKASAPHLNNKSKHS